ncbi:MAG: TonB-dependent receptor, partial [Pyrinomonadaceae bacterium]|nr:TonB-dependent receptor [Pyrinomonadaceae bacterium]
EFRFQFARDREPGEANSDDPEALIATGAGNLSIGRNNFSPRETTIKRAQFVDNVSYVTGRQNIKFGVDLNFDRIFNFFPGLFSGSYTFSPIDTNGDGIVENGYQAFEQRVPTAFTQNFPGANTNGATTSPDSTEYAFYLQDDLRITPQLTLNLGLRYDYQDLAEPRVRNPDPALLAAGFDTSRRPRDHNNFAPRFGLSYAFSERTVVRGGYGVFFGRTPAIMLGTAHNQNGISITGVNLNAAQIRSSGLIYPNIFTSVPTGVAPVRPNLFLFTDGYEQPVVQQARFGVEHEVLKNLSVSATYLLYRGTNLSRTRDVNLAPAVNVAAFDAGGAAFTVPRFTQPRPLAAYNRISLFESTARSLYNGLAIQATRRFSRGLQFIASYTLSKAEDDKPDQTAVVVAADDSKIVQNQLDTFSEYGISDLDVRHRFVFSPVYDTGQFTRTENRVLRALLSDYVFSGIVQLQSGFAYSASAGNDLNNDGNRSNDRAPNTVRNGFRTPSTYQFDARITRIIRFSESSRLSLILEGFNIFNRPNVAGTNNGFFSGNSFTTTGTGAATVVRFTTLSPTFGTARTFLTERQLQLAVKFDF